MSNSSITLDLSGLEDGPALDLAQLAQPEAVEQVLGLVGERMDALRRREGMRSESQSGRSHDAIAVLGERGSGKTTFLRSILAYLERPSAEDRGLVGKVINLGVIDPTLVSAKDNLFLGIIGRIQDEVDAALTVPSRDDAKYKAWSDSLRNMASGLSALDGVGTDPLAKSDWDDAEYAMEEGLAAVRANRQLECAFGEFLSRSLALLNADAFALGLDDIDVAFERGWIVLETLRRYLTDSRFLVFLAGDMELFSTLVRKHQWEKLGDMPVKFEPDRKRYYDQLVGHLEDQYLMKLLKPGNRISLQPLHYYLERRGRGKKVRVILEKGAKPKELGEALSTVLRDKLLRVQRRDDLALFQSVLLKEPIRTLIAVLLASRGDGDPESVSRSVMMMFTGPLRHLGMDARQLESLTDLDLGPNVITPLLDRGIFGEVADLRPVLADSQGNMGIFALNLALSRRMSTDPHMALDAILKFSLTMDAWALAPSGARETRVFMKHFAAFTGLASAGGARDFARNASTFLRSKEGERRRYARAADFGTLALWEGVGDQRDLLFKYGTKRNFDILRYFLQNGDRVNRGEDNVWYSLGDIIGDDFSSLIDNENYIEKESLPDFFLLSRHAINFSNLYLRLGDFGKFLLDQIVSRDEDFGLGGGYVSASYLFGSISRLMNRGDGGNIGEVLIESWENRSVRLSPKEGIHPMARAWRNGQSSAGDVSQSPGFSALVRRLADWRGAGDDAWKRERGIAPMPYSMVAKIWTRSRSAREEIDYNLNQSQITFREGRENELRSIAHGCGDYLHDSIVEFLNSILIEEIREGGFCDSDELLSSYIPVSNFSENLPRWKKLEVNKQTSLFWRIWTCPILGYYLNPKLGDFDQYIEDYRSADSEPKYSRKKALEHFFVQFDVSEKETMTFGNLHPLLNCLLTRSSEEVMRSGYESRKEAP